MVKVEAYRWNIQIKFQTGFAYMENKNNVAIAFHLSEQRKQVNEQVNMVRKLLNRANERDRVTAEATSGRRCTIKSDTKVNYKRAIVTQQPQKVTTHASSSNNVPSRKEKCPTTVPLSQKSLADMINEVVDSKISKIESVWSTQFKTLDDRIKSLEALNMITDKVETLDAGLTDLKADVEKRDSRSIALMKKLHEIHAHELEDKVAAVQQEQQVAFDEMHGDLRAQSKELLRLKAEVDEMATQDVRRPLTRDISQLPDMLEDLSLRLGKLETRQLLGEDSGEGRATPGKPSRSQNHPSASRQSGREEKLFNQAMQDNIAELNMHLDDIDAELSYLSSTVKTLASNATSDKLKGLDQALKEQDEELASVHKKVNGVGKHTSRAIRGLSESLQDMQQSILALYSWSNSVNTKLYLPIIAANAEFLVEGAAGSPFLQRENNGDGIRSAARVPAEDCRADGTPSNLRSSKGKKHSSNEQWYDADRV